MYVQPCRLDRTIRPLALLQLEHDFVAIHRTERKPQAADALCDFPQLEKMKVHSKTIFRSWPSTMSWMQTLHTQQDTETTTVLQKSPSLKQAWTKQNTIYPPFVELIRAQKKKVFYRTANSYVGHDSSTFSISFDRLLVRQSTVDVSVQIIVLPSLWNIIIMASHHPHIDGHPGLRRIYNTLHCTFYWSHRSKNIDQIVNICPSFARKPQSIVINVNCSFSCILEYATLLQGISKDFFPKQLEVISTCFSSPVHASRYRLILQADSSYRNDQENDRLYSKNRFWSFASPLRHLDVHPHW